MLSALFDHVVSKIEKQGVQNVRALLAVPTDPTHGDLALPCFALAKARRLAPSAVANDIALALEPDEIIASAVAQGPYVNILLHAAVFAQAAIASAGLAIKKPASTAPVMVEYFHANTHKAVHIGHIRIISLGESLCRLLEATGQSVIRVNYQGDIGPHVAKALWALLQLGKDWRAQVPPTRRAVWLANLYVAGNMASATNETVAQAIREINKKIYTGDTELVALWQETRQWCLHEFIEIYERWGVKYDRLYFESEVESAGKQLADDLLRKGVLEKSQGAIIANLEDEHLNVVVVITADGTPLYSAKDLALAELKIKEYPTLVRSLHVVGHEQELYFKQLLAIFKRGQFALANVSEHVVTALVRLAEGKMSSRAGNVIMYVDLFDRLINLASTETRTRHTNWDDATITKKAEVIALAGLKFFLLKSEPNREIVFDAKEVLRFDGDTGVYLLYTYARCRSLERKAGELAGVVQFDTLREAEERVLIRILAQYADVVTRAANERKPSLLAAYLLDCAHAFNAFYHKHPVISADTDTVATSRLVLVGAVRQTMQAGLKLLGIATVEEM